MKKPPPPTSVTENMQEVQELAELLGISGTPSYVIGTELVPGAIGYDGLQRRSRDPPCGAAVLPRPSAAQ